MRGEKINFTFYKAISQGSPPLARGKVHTGISTGASGGITPAYAGKSLDAASASSFARDHPRLRGEKLIFNYYERNVSGSPPLTRGKVIRCKDNPPIRGITPAYAGKRNPLSINNIRIGDHPRLRGEKLTAMYAALMGGGSPPLTRGKGDRQP